MAIKKQDVLSHFYNEVYKEYLYSGGPQQKGTAYANKVLEKQFLISGIDNMLEIGGGSGEHLRFVDNPPPKELLFPGYKETGYANFHRRCKRRPQESLEFCLGKCGKSAFRRFNNGSNLRKLCLTSLERSVSSLARDKTSSKT